MHVVQRCCRGRIKPSAEGFRASLHADVTDMVGVLDIKLEPLSRAAMSLVPEPVCCLAISGTVANTLSASTFLHVPCSNRALRPAPSANMWQHATLLSLHPKHN